MNKKHRHVTIYMPHGGEEQYCTKDLGDNNITVADTIECEENRVNIALKVDNKIEGYSYVGMPYVLHMF